MTAHPPPATPTMPTVLSLHRRAALGQEGPPGYREHDQFLPADPRRQAAPALAGLLVIALVDNVRTR